MAHTPPDTTRTTPSPSDGATDYHAMVATPERNEQLWKAVLRTAVDPIVLIDEQGTILRANPATSGLLGYSQAAMVGSNVSMLMPEPYRTEHDGYLRRYLETGQGTVIGVGRDVEALCADGTVLPIHLSVSEVNGTDRRMFTGIIHDLSARKAAEHQLREANELLERRVVERTAELERLMAELARSNRDLEQFAYVASHDLQAPLRNVRQGLDLLNEHLTETIGAGFDEEALELRELIVGAASRMEDLIKGLLAYARVHRDTRPATDSVDLNAVVAEILRHLQLDLDAAGISVSADTLPTVHGDPTQLRQLLQNLLQNAIKYRAADRDPEIRIEASEAEDHWVISVADNGIGVDEDQHQRIFELFRRGHPGYEGVGLGLAICQRIVERHGGTIHVDSQAGSGAAFTFTLSRMEADSRLQGEAQR